MATQHRHTVLRKGRSLAFRGLSLLALVVPWSTHAGEVYVSVGFELPVPVAVVPASLPVVVAPAAGGAAAARVVFHAPVVVRRLSVVIEERRWLYRDHLPPGLVKKFYRLEACIRETPS